jgi:hypothetical protein
MDAGNAPTAVSSGDDFKNGQKTPCLRTARTYAILTALPLAGFSNVRQFGNRKSSENHCINTMIKVVGHSVTLLNRCSKRLPSFVRA